ncbi:preprotein translocase subunit YajC [Nafulsella turpanensis]|uniref:preprotein translocase subunit YajC n=1 Tax=Nafulsella turpanensis TaxID=1265690 RepID=UPI000346A46A|nr:preprotein translocase subunit YajC [Nafulsella turpanensis]
MLEFILLQAPAGESGWMGNLILIGGIVIIFYFFMVRPQQKKAKDQKTFIESLKKGDQVVTIGGMHGRISAIEGEIVILDVDRGTKLTFEKSAISLDASKKLSKATKAA